MERGMTRGQLAEASGVSLGHLSNVEHGRSAMGLGALGRLAAALEVAPVYLVIFPEENELGWLIEELRKLSPDQLREFNRKMDARVGRQSRPRDGARS
jgi:transcriptional regulator with XRE-family HTH domain